MTITYGMDVTRHTRQFLQTVFHIITAADYSDIKAFFRNAWKQFLTMRLHATHDIGNAAGAGYRYLHDGQILDLKRKPFACLSFLFGLSLPRQTNGISVSMNKTILKLREVFLYAGIILLSCFAALWLIIKGKRQK